MTAPLYQIGERVRTKDGAVHEITGLAEYRDHDPEYQLGDFNGYRVWATESDLVLVTQ